MRPVFVSQAIVSIRRIATEVFGHWPQMLACLLLSLLVLAPFFVVFPAGDELIQVRKKSQFLVLGISLCLLAMIWRKAYVVACLLLLPPMLVYQHINRQWGRGQLDSRLEAVYESPPNEIREYLLTHVDSTDIVFLLASVVIAVILLKLAGQWKMESGLMRRLAGTAAIVLFAIIAGLGIDVRMKSFPPYALAREASKVKDRYDLLSGRNEYLRRNPLGENDCRSPYDKVVIVLGESATTGHMSIFGYDRPTTPFAIASNPTAFRALSPANQTRYSLGMMLTKARPGSFDAFYTSHSLVSQLASCGYRTLWISNQGRRGEYDSFSTSLANEADEQIFLNEWTWHDVKLDGQIIESLDARNVYERERHATFIHLIGSHPEYLQRVPAGFGPWRPSDPVSQYDNSILYTDRVLSRLFDRFSGESLLFIYVSDHGQLVSNPKFGAGFNPAFKEEFQAPLLIWTNDQRRTEAIRRAVGEDQINLESFDDLVGYLTGISRSLRVSTRQEVSVLSPENTADYASLASLAERSKHLIAQAKIADARERRNREAENRRRGKKPERKSPG